eukprot:s793_g4.t1
MECWARRLVATAACIVLPFGLVQIWRQPSFMHELPKLLRMQGPPATSDTFLEAGVREVAVASRDSARTEVQKPVTTAVPTDEITTSSAWSTTTHSVAFVGCPKLDFLGGATLPMPVKTVGRLHTKESDWAERFNLSSLVVNAGNVSNLPYMLGAWGNYHMVVYHAQESPPAVVFMSTTANILSQKTAKVCLTYNFAYALEHGLDFVGLSIPCWRTKLGAGWVKPWGLQEAVRQRYIRPPWVLILDHDATVNPKYWGEDLLSTVRERYHADGDEWVAICESEPLPGKKMITVSEDICKADGTTTCSYRGQEQCIHEVDRCITNRKHALEKAAGTKWWKKNEGCNIGALFLWLPRYRDEKLKYLDTWLGARFRGDCLMSYDLATFKSDQGAFNYCFLPHHHKEIMLVKGGSFAPWNWPAKSQFIVHGKQNDFLKMLRGVCKKLRRVPASARHVVCGD